MELESLLKERDGYQGPYWFPSGLGELCTGGMVHEEQSQIPEVNSEPSNESIQKWERVVSEVRAEIRASLA